MNAGARSAKFLQNSNIAGARAATPRLGHVLSSFCFCFSIWSTSFLTVHFYYHTPSSIGMLIQRTQRGHINELRWHAFASGALNRLRH